MACADTYRIATFNIGLSREGPGLLLRDLRKGENADRIGEIAAVKPDIVALQGFDFDLDGLALAEFQRVLAELDHPMPHSFSRPSNSGVPSGFDLNRNGRFGEAEDAEGYGEFTGQKGMAVLSRFPIAAEAAVDFTDVTWAEQDWAVPPMTEDAPYFSEPEWQALPLFSVGAWAVPVSTPRGELWLLTGQSSSPVFDGPEDRNGLRNAAQMRFWQEIIDGGEVDGWTLRKGSWVFAGGLNADPLDGEGHKPDLLELLGHAAVQDPLPRGSGGAADPDKGHLGDPARDTVRWRRENGPGNMRVDYVLPSAKLDVHGSGVHWFPGGSDDGDFRHFIVWADISLQ